MGLFKMALARLLSQGVAGIVDGNLSTMAKGGFYSLITVISIMATGYLSNLEKRFAAVDGIGATLNTMAGSIVELNKNMAMLLERSQSQQKILELHSMSINGMDRRVQRLEDPITQPKEKK